MCLSVGSRLKPERNQPADEDDPSLKEALLGTEQWFTTILLPSQHAIVRLGAHWRHVCMMKGNYISGAGNVNTSLFYDPKWLFSIQLLISSVVTDPVWGCTDWFP